MTTAHKNSPSQYSWAVQPAVAQAAQDILADACRRNSRLAYLAGKLLQRTGTRLFDWVDSFKLPTGDPLLGELAVNGYQSEETAVGTVWTHPEAMVPPILEQDSPGVAICLKAESVTAFLRAHDWAHRFVEDVCRGALLGAEGGQFRGASIASEGGVELFAIERHGWPHFTPPENSAQQIAAASRHYDQFRLRRREFSNEAEGFAHATELVRSAAGEIGLDWACDRFFAAERDYWQSRNRAAQVQKARQDGLGLGWANHDHHTYRSSRQHFARLVGMFEELGFHCRERFYAGRDAGWGAQVLEQPQAGIVIFADVDLAPEEVAGDFAHQPLPERGELGTVGLWCRLHGESFLQAGMHHLECQFDFTTARDQLASADVPSMDPFTDFDYLKQCFTEGQMWPIEPHRIDGLLAEGLISPRDAERFRNDGALGSHLEILERNEGYKGFNQTGISDIIRRTDPRKP